MKQQEEQEKKAKAKLEKQQKKEQKALLKMQQEEEKQRQKELKRQESKLAAEAKQAEAMKSSKLVPPEASEATLAEDSVTEELTLPEKHEDWSKLEDEAHALALKEGIEQSRASVSSDMLGDKLATSGPVSFQLSDDTSARGSTRKKDKKEKAKGRRGFGRWIKRSSSDKKEAVTPEKKGLSRRSSHSSTGTEQRPSSPGSQTSLTTPHGSHPDMSVDGEDENFMVSNIQPDSCTCHKHSGAYIILFMSYPRLPPHPAAASSIGIASIPPPPHPVKAASLVCAPECLSSHNCVCRDQTST